MNNLEQLTASREQCDKIMALGIIPTAFLWWMEDESTTSEDRENKRVKYEVCIVNAPEPGPDCLPAWTKAEIDVFIGPEAGEKPDLFTRLQLGQSKMQTPETYPVFFVDKMQVFKNGAIASAAALIYLLEKGLVKASEANERYNKLFKPLK